MRIVVFLFPLFLSYIAWAQPIYKSRVVDSETGEGLAYASIYASKDNGTLTNAEGVFSIEANNEDVLRISSVGYQTLEIKAAELKDEVSMASMVSNTHAVKALDAERIMNKMIKRLQREYVHSNEKRDNYFFRITNSIDGKQELLEAYLTAKGATSLHDLSFLAGRRIQGHDSTVEESSIDYSCFQKMLELGPMIFKPWQRIITPIYRGATSKPHTITQMNTYVETNAPDFFRRDIDTHRLNADTYKWETAPKLEMDKRSYSYSAQEIDGENGRKIYIVKSEGIISSNAFIDGTFYVEDKSYALLRFEGKLHNYNIEQEQDSRREWRKVEPIIIITYKRDGKYTEMESIVIKIEDDNLTSRAVAFNLGSRKIPFNTKEYTNSENLIEVIDQAGTTPLMWQANVLQHTDEEASLINRHNTLGEGEGNYLDHP